MQSKYNKTNVWLSFSVFEPSGVARNILLNSLSLQTWMWSSTSHT